MRRRVFVQVWCELDPALILRVESGAKRPVAEPGDQLLRVSLAGRRGIAEAQALAGWEITAFSLGKDHDVALRHALAAGADHAVRLCVAEAETEARIIGALARWLAEERPSLVIGDRRMGQVAARLKWAHLAGLRSLRHEAGTITARRTLERGAEEEVWATVPALVRVESGDNPVPYVAWARMAQVRDHAIRTVWIGGEAGRYDREGRPGDLYVTRPRTKLGLAEVTSAKPAKAADRMGALMGLSRPGGPKVAAKPPGTAVRTPEHLAEELVRYLAHHRFLEE